MNFSPTDQRTAASGAHSSLGRLVLAKLKDVGRERRGHGEQLCVGVPAHWVKGETICRAADVGGRGT